MSRGKAKLVAVSALCFHRSSRALLGRLSPADGDALVSVRALRISVTLRLGG